MKTYHLIFRKLPTKAKRIEWIDIAKAISIVAIIIGHTINYDGKIAVFIFPFTCQYFLFYQDIHINRL